MITVLTSRKTVALEADRGHGSDTFVASIVNATLIDLGLLT